ncbi:hypothetical protein F3X30_17575 [Salmonella enterica]|nr:hypothetical protein [Salmonella enterica]ECW3064044.1 hypothetical protein [Salmonella enterica subsp. enterica serovar Rubislaw]
MVTALTVTFKKRHLHRMVSKLHGNASVSCVNVGYSPPELFTHTQCTAFTSEPKVRVGFVSSARPDPRGGEPVTAIPYRNRIYLFFCL